MEDKMDINTIPTAKDVADIIAKMVQEKTSLRCETYADDHGKAVIISDHTHPIARITPYRNCIRVTARPLDPEAVVTSIPSKMTSPNGMRKFTAHLNDAAPHVTAAALATPTD